MRKSRGDQETRGTDKGIEEREIGGVKELLRVQQLRPTGDRESQLFYNVGRFF
jgi:hypothetical protein